MSWATHPTSEMPPSIGRHRRAGTATMILVLAGVLLLAAVATAALAPSLFGWAPKVAFSAPAASPSSTVEVERATPPTTAPPKRKPSPTTRPAPRPATALSDVDRQVLALTNAERIRRGCRPLHLDRDLTTAARLHSVEMATYQRLDHDGRNGKDPGDRMREAGYRTDRGWGENIAKGDRTAEAVVESWMDSRDHRANILNCSWRSMGAGAARVGNGQIYWTQDFGGR